MKSPPTLSRNATSAAPSGLVNDTPMKVRVRFSPEIAHAVRGRIWHPDQRLETDGAGRVIIEFEAAGEKELASWVLSYGMYAEVLEPPRLRRGNSPPDRGNVPFLFKR